MQRKLSMMLLIIQTLAVFSVIFSGCKPNVNDNLKSIPRWAEQLSQMIPSFIERVQFIDVKRYQINSEYQAEVDIEVMFNNSPAVIVTSFQSIEYLAWIDGEPTYFIFITKSDLSGYSKKLMEHQWSYEEYMGKKIWRKENEPNLLIEANYLVMGYGLNVMGTIQTMTGNRQALFADTEFMEIMSKLPRDWLFSVFQRDTLFANEPPYSSKVISGDVFTDDNQIQRTIIATSDYVKDAELYIRSVAVQLQENLDWQNVVFSYEGNYWKLNATRTTESVLDQAEQ
jgi:hypothetical protein